MLVSARELHALLERRQTALLDVRWSLGGPPGFPQYLEGHIPGAVFIDLESELSGPPGSGGRHPLPDPARFTAAMRTAGVFNDRPVVVYDAASSLAAARAWWLLRHFGHTQVSVLDGGLAAWSDAGFPLQAEISAPDAGDFVARPGAMSVLDASGAAKLAASGVLIDARAPERFRGEHEPVDPVAGRIPGAKNRPSTENVERSGRFLAPDELRVAFGSLGIDDGVSVGAYCGSGVTAAHEVLALELAGYPAALYPGSWSEWITDAARPVQRG